ncbi:MAG: hypothetical protein Q6K90_06380, partial [Gloeomargarita sp. HHBFW_bins_162]
MRWWRGAIGLLVTAGIWGWSGSSQPQSLATGAWHQAAFPVEQFVAYTSPFGPRGEEFHYGLDIAAPE